MRLLFIVGVGIGLASDMMIMVIASDRKIGGIISSRMVWGLMKISLLYPLLPGLLDWYAQKPE